MSEQLIKNPFTQMARIAAKQHWCWNLYCPFCGHLPFRYALLDMANGTLPGSADWKMSSWPNSRDLYKERWGRMPKAGQPDSWTLICEKALAEMMVDIDIAEMIEHVPFPEFVYILGVGLSYTERAERANRKISRSLAGQMLEKMNLNEEGKAFYAPRAAGDEVLSWRDAPMIIKIFEQASGGKQQELKGNFVFTFKTTVPNFLDRGGRRRLIAEMMVSYNQQAAMTPRFYAYVFTDSEVVLFANVENSYSFANGFLSHSAQSMGMSKESLLVLDQIKDYGVWRRGSQPRLVSDDLEEMERYLRRVLRIPVEREYVSQPSHWVWSSANPDPLVDIALSQLDEPADG